LEHSENNRLGRDFKWIPRAVEDRFENLARVEAGRRGFGIVRRIVKVNVRLDNRHGAAIGFKAGRSVRVVEGVRHLGQFVIALGLFFGFATRTSNIFGISISSGAVIYGSGNQSPTRFIGNKSSNPDTLILNYAFIFEKLAHRKSHECKYTLLDGLNL